MQFIKIRRGHDAVIVSDTTKVIGERFWCEVLFQYPSGDMLVRVDNSTIGPGVPRMDEILVLPATENILDERAA